MALSYTVEHDVYDYIFLQLPRFGNQLRNRTVKVIPKKHSCTTCINCHSVTNSAIVQGIYKDPVTNEVLLKNVSKVQFWSLNFV